MLIFFLQVKQQWMEPLQALISRINHSFSFFFKTMKCAGEVDLHIPENPVRISNDLWCRGHHFTRLLYVSVGNNFAFNQCQRRIDVIVRLNMVEFWICHVLL